VLVDGEQEKASMKLRGGERIAITGDRIPRPLGQRRKTIPLDVVFEDADLAVVNKPAGMMVHAGSGQTEDARNRGTLSMRCSTGSRPSLDRGDLRPALCTG